MDGSQQNERSNMQRFSVGVVRAHRKAGCPGKPGQHTQNPRRRPECRAEAGKGFGQMRHLPCYCTVVLKMTVTVSPAFNSPAVAWPPSTGRMVAKVAVIAWPAISSPSAVLLVK